MKNPEMIRPVSFGVVDRVISFQNMYLTNYSQLYLSMSTGVLQTTVLVLPGIACEQAQREFKESLFAGYTG